ncbi:murein L,D-transpeptidase catalytic domain family protein [Flavobacterium difficile]|uniref:Murein L,D-transpeptidase catalytic domain family protein n=1 Tax=Flavobacterium difficile TaxID=2709659 RepID=A0ABX0I8P4_9FLAO|nr:murein L,D-transpeptidase catalytic domain family protein [Flavobacterium difficile]NHM01816.1 murein L,D-transpeptidase catalytic domain family protein [Flavobacterium difficile]
MSYKFLPLVFLGFILNLSNNKTTFKTTSKSESVNTEIAKPTKIAENKVLTFEEKTALIYNSIEAGFYSLPKLETFTKAFEGYSALENQGKIKNSILTIVDFSFSSTKERMWVIDMEQKKILLQTLVSHGMNSGKEFAKSFSNQNESFKSSLGFFITGETYTGKHGISLKLDGQEFGLNDNARERAVVIHGAEYVSKKLANKQGYIGRSQGCPAVAPEIAPKLINTIKNKSVLFIYHPTRMYVNKSRLVS